MKLWVILTLISSVAQAGLYSPQTWPNKKIEVCFARGGLDIRDAGGNPTTTSALKASDRAKVRLWTEHDYTPQTTGIHFVGWKDCEEAPEAEIVVFYSWRSRIWHALAGGTEGYAYVGPVAQGMYPEFPNAKNFVWLSRAGFSRGVTLHEFGHAAGLYHEHERKERTQDPACDDYSKNPIREPSRYEIYFGAYDSKSIMNYCYLNSRGGDRNGLSEGDLAVLRFLYRK
jgi:hypothetical protein